MLTILKYMSMQMDMLVMTKWTLIIWKRRCKAFCQESTFIEPKKKPFLSHFYGDWMHTTSKSTKNNYEEALEVLENER